MNKESLSFNQVQQQSEAGHEPTILIERSNGNIQTAKLSGHIDHNGRLVAEFVDAADGKTKLKSVTPEGMSDGVQEALAQELSGTPDGIRPDGFNPHAISGEELKKLREQRQEGMGHVAVETALQDPEEIDKSKAAAEIETINEELKNLTEDLTEDEQVAVWKYGTAIHDNEINEAINNLKHTYPEGDVAERYRTLMQRKIKLQRS